MTIIIMTISLLRLQRNFSGLSKLKGVSCFDVAGVPCSVPGAATEKTDHRHLGSGRGLGFYDFWGLEFKVLGFRVLGLWICKGVGCSAQGFTSLVLLGCRFFFGSGFCVAGLVFEVSKLSLNPKRP